MNYCSDLPSRWAQTEHFTQALLTSLSGSMRLLGPDTAFSRRSLEAWPKRLNSGTIFHSGSQFSITQGSQCAEHNLPCTGLSGFDRGELLCDGFSTLAGISAALRCLVT